MKTAYYENVTDIFVYSRECTKRLLNKVKDLNYLILGIVKHLKRLLLDKANRGLKIHS